MRLKSSKIKPLEFEWDEYNKEKIWKKHAVPFKECEEVFFNKNYTIYPDEKHSESEIRFLCLGSTLRGKKLTIIFTIRSGNIRIISARNMSKKERRIYEKK